MRIGISTPRGYELTGALQKLAFFETAERLLGWLMLGGMLPLRARAGRR
jgi:hypothetical protein